jgi:dTDP-4-dehydrorhamnose reductase
MLGAEISLQMEKFGLHFIATDREVDIADLVALDRFIEKQAEPLTWIINCTAYTAVDKAEDDVEICRSLNTDGPGNIAAVAMQNGARLIHISTDYVFNGIGVMDDARGGIRPYKEDDPTNPITIYGLTKRDGELTVLKNNPRSYIIRTAWLYGRHGSNFVTAMLRLMNEQNEIKVVNDQYGSPTWVGDIAKLIIEIINTGHQTQKLPYGIYHYTNKGNITWFEFAREIYSQGRRLGLLNNVCAVRPCTSAEYHTKAKRPGYSVLDKTKIEAALGIDIPAWTESLIKYLQESKQ